MTSPQVEITPPEPPGQAIVPRRPNGTWLPGRTPNPGGRPRAGITVVSLARKHTRAAVETLAEIAADPKAKRKDRIAAAEALLNRGWGRPVIAVSEEQQQVILVIEGPDRGIMPSRGCSPT
jgi:hypothetical protein